jgi:hypothetical protein
VSVQFKPVPDPPASLDVVADAQRAVPLVPDSEDDCCARLARRLELPTRDDGRTWLTFLRALGLAEKTDSGYRRTRTDPTPAHLRDAFEANVFAVGAVLDALDSETPTTAEEAFAAVESRVPEWERHRDEQWRHVWRRRVETILDWAVLLELARADEGGYVRVAGEAPS